MVQEYRPAVERPGADHAQGQPATHVREQDLRCGHRVPTGGPLGGATPLDLAAIYATHFAAVARWVRGFGANDADVEDLTQEVFIIVGRKLDAFDGRNLRGFLYSIARRTVRDHRRSTWYRRSIRGELPIEWWLFATTEPTGAPTVETLHLRRTLGSALGHMSEKLRTTFILFEIDGYTGDEIAQLQSLPVRTVWTRLFYARKAFFRIVTELLPGSVGEEEHASCHHGEGSTGSVRKDTA